MLALCMMCAMTGCAQNTNETTAAPTSAETTAAPAETTEAQTTEAAAYGGSIFADILKSTVNNVRETED